MDITILPAASRAQSPARSPAQSTSYLPTQSRAQSPSQASGQASSQTAFNWPPNCLPPEAIFESREALFRSINTWASSKGYAFVTLRSKREGGCLKVVYACDRSSKPPAYKERQRQTTTKRTDCQFSVLAKELPNGSWALKHRLGQAFSAHNHEPSPGPSAHPIHRQLSGGTSQLPGLRRAGVPPRQIQSILRQAGSLATRQDIYNQLVSRHWRYLQGRDRCQARYGRRGSQGIGLRS